MALHRVYGSFLGRFRMLENIKVDKLKVATPNGVFTVIVPKLQEKELDVKVIDISG